MPIGTDSFTIASLGHTGTGSYSGPGTYGIRMRMNKTVTLRSLTYRASTFIIMRPTVWRVSDQANMAQGSDIELNAGNETELPITCLLSSGVEYMISVYISSSGSLARTATMSMPHNHSFSGPTGVVGEVLGGLTNASGNAYPSTSYAPARELFMGMSVDGPNTLPNAPTGVTVTEQSGSSSPIVENQLFRAGWTHSDPDANVQANYELRYRRLT